MPRRPPAADAAHMTVLDIRYAPQDRAAGPARGDGGRFGRAPSPPTFDDERTSKVDHLRESIRSGAYAVDERAVAAAILARLLDGRGLAPEPRS